MTPHAQAAAAYARPGAPTRTDRATEYAAFAAITARLRASARPETPFADLARALHDNRALWSTLAADVAGDGNGLPAELRARLFYLAEFTAQHSRKVLAGTADAAPLVDINTAVMRGLRAGGVAP